MKYKFIKNNSKKIFPIGLGCGIGNYNSHYSYKELLTIIRKSFEYGVNFFDTAPVYGDGASEKILGNAFSLREKEKIFIATKISPEMLSSSNIIKSVNNSRKNLKVNNIDLGFIHELENSILHRIEEAFTQAKEASFPTLVDTLNDVYAGARNE